LAEKMKQRDAASAPTVGDRVAYVIVKSTKGSKAYEKSEDPIFVLENNLPIDFNYYIENQIKQPLVRIFEPIFGDISNTETKLFSGEHMRVINQPKVIGSSGLGKFIVVLPDCLGCKKILPKNYDDVICLECQPKRRSLFIEKRLELN
jgi:DNA polymerase delta subunit 1